jgi:hypothetical protein
MFQLICVSAEYFDDRFQMVFHNRYSKEATSAAEIARLGVYWLWYCQLSFDGTTPDLCSHDESEFCSWLM